tara:strand:- start:178 stop:570 length:393 start_codon:yes stop_codon:yes gene_type:complete
MIGFEFCYYHEPSMEETRLDNSRMGGRTPRKLPESVPYPKMETLEDVRQFAVETLHQVRTGHLEPRTAAVVSSLVAHVLKTLPEVDSAAESVSEKLRGLLSDDLPESREDDEVSESLPDNGPGDWETHAL